MSIIGQWTFEDSDGTGVDTSVNSNPAIFTDGAFQNTTGSSVFDGANDYVEIADAAQYAISSATIHGTFTAATGSMDGTQSTSIVDTSLQALVSRDSSGFDGGGHLTIYLDGDGSLWIRHQSDTASYEIRTAPGVVSENTEFDLVYEISDTDGIVVYVDGVQVGSNTDHVTNGDSLALSGNTEPWTLGASQVTSSDGVADNLQQFFEGTIGHFEIYDEALSPAELNTLHDLSDGVDDGLIAGTAGDDTIYGGPSVNAEDGGLVIDDTITAGDGNDVVYAGDGDDIISGGSGYDIVTGGAGSDTLIVSDGDGTINFDGGSSGSDIDVIDLSGLSGSVLANQNNLNDGIVAVIHSNVEHFIGTNQGDVLNFTGGGYSVTIEGGGGDDILLGGNDADEIYGGSGADTIYAFSDGVGDLYDGGADNDLFYAFDGFGSDTIVGGDGTDRVNLIYLTGGVTANFTAPYAGTITDDTDTITFSETEIFDLTDFDDTVQGGTSYLNIYTGDGNDSVDGSTANDGIHLGDGADTASGGLGRDHIRGHLGNDDIAGGADGDWLYGGDGNDTVSGGDGDDDIGGDAGSDTLSGGTGDDTITTGAGDDLVVLEQLGAHDTVTDFDISDTDLDGNSNDQLDVSDLRDLAGNPVNVWDVVVSDDGSGNARLTFPEGESLTLQGIAPAQMTSQQMMASGIPCFTAGTMILTPEGERPVEDLRVGDLVTTRDRGPQPIHWIASRSLGPAELSAFPELRPVRLDADWTGTGRDLVVSRQHGIVASNQEDPSEFLVRAIQLARMKGGKARIVNGIRRVTYVHLLLPQHEIIYANGTAAESFYPGPRSTEALSPTSLLSLIAHLPRLAVDGPEAVYGPAVLDYARSKNLPTKLEALMPRITRADLACLAPNQRRQAQFSAKAKGSFVRNSDIKRTTSCLAATQRMHLADVIAAPASIISKPCPLWAPTSH